MRYSILFLFLLPIAVYGQSVTATYSSGDISTNLNAYSGTCNGPLTTLTVTLPVGGLYQVTGIDISYTMTAQGGGFKSHQRSQIHFQYAGISESTVYQGTGDIGGIQSYSRTNVSIANGAYPGGTNLIFEMRAWRTSQGSGCNITFNKVDNYSWTLTVYYTSIPLDGNIGIGTLNPHSSALLDLKSVQKGFLLPRMTKELRNQIGSPVEGLLLYCTNCAPIGVYQYKGAMWLPLAGLSLEDGDGDTKILVEKNPDEDKIRFDMGGTEYFVMNGPKLQINNSGRSVFIGEGAGLNDDLSNNANVFIGSRAGQNTIGGTENVAIGDSSLYTNSNGSKNTAIGAKSLRNNSSGNSNIALGRNALYKNTTTNNNIAIGSESLYYNIGSANIGIGSNTLFYNQSGEGNIAIGSSNSFYNVDGSYNTALGFSSLSANLSGDYNVAIGPWSLFSNQSNNNVAVGYWSLYNNEVGQNNTAIGTEALRFNNAVGNVATGYRSLYSNTLGTYNSAYGHQALYNNTLGTENTAFGDVSLYTNNTGHQNVAAGRAAMYSNTSGYLNAALGFAALYYNTTGFRNVALGVGALYYNNTGQSNVAIGNDALVYSGSGSFNTGIGRAASPNNGANPSNFTALGYNAGYIGSGSNTMEMGNTSIGWIGGQVGWSTYASDRRVKDNIQSNVPGLTFINRLNPVTYNLNIHRQNEICGIVDTATWEGKYDIEKIVQSGFIAQEVERAAIETNYDFNGYTPPKGNAKMYSMQYSAFVVPLVKAVQELSAENTALKEEIARQSKLINELKDTMEVRFQNLENRLQGQ